MQKKNEWRAIATLLPYLLEYKGRVAIALACLVAAKLANVGVPLVMKEVVDGLDADVAVVAVPVALLAMYGILRFSTTLFAELRDVVFIRVTQRAIRRVALGVFRHLHSLSLRFHLDRQTGGMTRDIERGTAGISTLLSYVLFSILPVILEFSLVAAVLITKFDWRFAAVTFGAVVVYIAFTVLVTEWRMEIRRRANELDSRANTRAVDSLLNYETVKYFGNEEFEARRYDEQLTKYEAAATQNEASLGLLNIGQSLIIAIAVTLHQRAGVAGTERSELLDDVEEPGSDLLERHLRLGDGVTGRPGRGALVGPPREHGRPGDLRTDLTVMCETVRAFSQLASCSRPSTTEEFLREVDQLHERLRELEEVRRDGDISPEPRASLDVTNGSISLLVPEYSVITLHGVAIPEPGAIGALAGAAALLLRRRRVP